MKGSFSAVSTPISATRHSFCRVFQDLQNELAEFSKKIAKFVNFKFLQILQNLGEISRTKLDNFVESDLEKCRKLSICKLVAKIGVDTAEKEPRKE